MSPHPIDELFARGLRNAEENPPPQLWEDIAQERNWAHMTLLHLRRKWGWLALLLLVGGTATYLGGRPSGAEMAGETPGPAAGPVVTAGLVAPGTPAEGSAPVHFTSEAEYRPGPASALPTPMAAALPAELTSAEAAPAASPDVIAHQHGSNADATGAKGQRERAGKEVEQHRSGMATSLLTGPEPATGPASVPSSPVARAGSRVPTTVQGLSQVTTGMLHLLPPDVQRAPLDAGPLPGRTLHFRGPHRSWWAMVTAGQYRETRTWRGADAQLVQALQGTETDHHTVHFGLLVGVRAKGGWGLATGLEYGAVRYDFRHLDRFRSVRDSVVTNVVTFNTVVVGSFTDTVTTSTEVRQAVAAVNHHTVLRVPLEASWKKPWRRWQWGVRGGLALEFNTMRAGATLMSGPEGTRSVDIATMETRSVVLVNGSVGVDLGYALNDRTILWLSPGYTSGLLSLTPMDDKPFAVPERTGLRFGLSYTFHTDR